MNYKESYGYFRLRFGEVIYYYSLITEMLIKQGIFAAFHSNYMQESDLGLSSSRISMEHLPIWGLFLQNWPLSSGSERQVPCSISGGRKKQTNKQWEAVKSPQ